MENRGAVGEDAKVESGITCRAMERERERKEWRESKIKERQEATGKVTAKEMSKQKKKSWRQNRLKRQVKERSERHGVKESASTQIKRKRQNEGISYSKALRKSSALYK